MNAGGFVPNQKNRQMIISRFELPRSRRRLLCWEFLGRQGPISLSTRIPVTCTDQRRAVFLKFPVRQSGQPSSKRIWCANPSVSPQLPQSSLSGCEPAFMHVAPGKKTIPVVPGEPAGTTPASLTSAYPAYLPGCQGTPPRSSSLRCDDGHTRA